MRHDEVRREEPRRYREDRDDTPDTNGGWNGPIPHFLSVALTS